MYLIFSPCGRYLSSAGSDHRVLVWDLSNGSLVAELISHTNSIYCLSFSRDGNLLVSGGLDKCIKIWDFSKLMEENHDDENASTLSSEMKKPKDIFLLATFPTKSTTVLGTHFTRRNVLLAAGPFEG
ncbi:Transcription initiation factor TFIID subunit 5 [Armadillidium vulgare]|nr:Transcription initiation factor TFIID subunit 5 [Armadillidium vulgare]